MERDEDVEREDSPKANALGHLRRIYREASERGQKLTRLSRRIEIATLSLSALTSGALWTLISTNFETAASWTGAVLTTLVAGLTAYQQQLGPKKQAEAIHHLFNAIGLEIAIIEGSPRFNQQQYWHRLKYLEAHRMKVMSPPKKGETFEVPE